MTDDARQRLEGMLSLLEREAEALLPLGDPRLADTLRSMATLRAEIVTALASLDDTGDRP